MVSATMLPPSELSAFGRLNYIRLVLLLEVQVMNRPSYLDRSNAILDIDDNVGVLLFRHALKDTRC